MSAGLGCGVGAGWLPSFSAVVQLTSVEPERVEATVPDIPFVNFAVVITFPEFDCVTAFGEIRL